ncbi:MAG: plasmid replication/partition related protein [Lysobacterales bacterium 14-68-21]|nr:MAG: plasmid replication/partition related protein [Xanthomonadales bacterium 15-68-25]OZB63001.1 MAG: plasmid replication/partition related protein [Xanthomonadales bacterium 14-68-21]
MDIVVNEELKAYIEPMTPEEYEALERSLLAEGCRDALVLWGETLVDGHHRYAICRKHGLPFRTVQHPHFQSMDDVHLWMIDQHLGRRSLSVFQRGELALRKRDILTTRRAQARAVSATKLPPLPPIPEHAEAATEGTAAMDEPLPGAPETPVEAPPSREALAKAARLSNAQVGLIEKIRRQAAPEVVEAVKAGTISINAAAAVASLPEEEQRAAAGGGDKELKEAARRVRESRRKPKEAPAADQEAGAGTGDELQQLRQRVAELTAEVASLRQQLAELQGG